MQIDVVWWCEVPNCIVMNLHVKGVEKYFCFLVFVQHVSVLLRFDSVEALLCYLIFSQEVKKVCFIYSCVN
jgi:hypothetical protein